MDLATVGAASIGMSLSKVQQSVSVTMLKKVMDTQEASAQMLLEGMAAAAPSFGHILDTYA